MGGNKGVKPEEGEQSTENGKITAKRSDRGRRKEPKNRYHQSEVEAAEKSQRGWNEWVGVPREWGGKENKRKALNTTKQTGSNMAQKTTQKKEMAGRD